MNSSLSVSAITRPISKFFSKYHATIFFTIITLLLAGAILSLFLTTHESNQDATTPDSVTSTFDKETAERIKTLRESNQATDNFVFPTSRSNPFVE